MCVASPDRSKTVEKEHITFLGIAPMIESRQNRLLYSLTSRCAELGYHDVRITGLSECIRRPNAITSAIHPADLCPVGLVKFPPSNPTKSYQEPDKMPDVSPWVNAEDEAHEVSVDD